MKQVTLNHYNVSNITPTTCTVCGIIESTGIRECVGGVDITEYTQGIIRTVHCIYILGKNNADAPTIP